MCPCVSPYYLQCLHAVYVSLCFCLVLMAITHTSREMVLVRVKFGLSAVVRLHPWVMHSETTVDV